MLSNSMLTVSVACILAFYVQSGLGLTVTEPSEGYSWDPSASLPVHWSSVSTDPTSFGIQISNQDSNTYPQGFSQDVTKDVKASEESYSITGISSLKVGSGYRVNLVSSTGGILAQSPPFNVTSSSSSTSSNSTSTTNASHNMTGTVSSQQSNSSVTPHSTTGSSTTSPNVTSSGHPASGATNSADSARLRIQECVGIVMALTISLILV